MVKNDALIHNQATILKNFGNQVGQLANELRNKPQSVLPIDTENLRSSSKEIVKLSP